MGCYIVAEPDRESGQYNLDKNSEADDYDNPWKTTLDRYFPEFMAMYFPRAAAQINWEKGYESLDTELQSLVRDAELGKRFADKLVRVKLISGEEDLIYAHV